MIGGPAQASKLREKLAQNTYVLGTAITLQDPLAVELAAVAGYDFVRIEREHSPISDSTFVNMVRAADAHDLPVLVRVPDAGAKTILPCVEAGAAGVLVAHARTREDAEAAVREVRFAPLGHRSVYVKSRAALHGAQSPEEYVRETNSQLLVGLLIEDAVGLHSATEMSEIDGVDFLSIGRYDFAQEIGRFLQPGHEDVKLAEDEIIRAAQDNGKMASLSAQSPSALRDLLRRGVKFLLTDADSDAMLRGWKQRVEECRRALDEESSE